jgi:hypothetical protein
MKVSMAASSTDDDESKLLTTNAFAPPELTIAVAKPETSLVYLPLSTDRPETRTLVLLPGTGVVRCRVEHFYLDELREPYYAVSYTWGERELRENINVNDVEVMVPEEQWTVLSTLRDYHMTGSHLRLWMDFIRTDQESFAERGHQVSIMGKIFSAAHTVFCCLGGATSDTATQLATFNRLYP